MSRAVSSEIASRRVVSAAGVNATVRRLLPDDYRADWTESVENLRPGPAHVCLYIGFEGDIRQTGCGSANKWFYRTWDTEVEHWNIDGPDVGPTGPLPDAPLLYCSFPSLKDPLHDPGPDLLHTGEVVTFVPWDSFAKWQESRRKKRSDEYEALKQRMHDSLLEQFLREIPALRPFVRFSELSTPLTTDHFCRPVRGSIYGLEPTPERFANEYLRPRGKIRSLFFSGSEVTTVGVMGAMMGGVLAATSAEPVRAMEFLKRAR